jgi:hypothetical protein
MPPQHAPESLTMLVIDSACRFIQKSGIIAKVVEDLRSTTHTVLATAYTHVLLQFSYHQDNASQMVQSTPLLSLVPTLLHSCGASPRSPLVPLVLDLLWNVLEPMPSPRSLPEEVRVPLQAKYHTFECICPPDTRSGEAGLQCPLLPIS